MIRLIWICTSYCQNFKYFGNAEIIKMDWNTYTSHEVTLVIPVHGGHIIIFLFLLNRPYSYQKESLKYSFHFSYVEMNLKYEKVQSSSSLKCFEPFQYKFPLNNENQSNFEKSISRYQMSSIVTKPTKWHVRPAKTQISLGIRQVWSESSLSAWRKLWYLATH